MDGFNKCLIEMNSLKYEVPRQEVAFKLMMYESKNIDSSI